MGSPVTLAVSARSTSVSRHHRCTLLLETIPLAATAVSLAVLLPRQAEERLES
jgi:hypothetical protein